MLAPPDLPKRRPPILADERPKQIPGSLINSKHSIEGLLGEQVTFLAASLLAFAVPFFAMVFVLAPQVTR